MTEKVLNILLDVKPNIDYEKEMCMVDDGLIDSVEIVQIFSAIEEEFSVQLMPEDVVPSNFNSLNAICELIQMRSV